jgi:serine/threonine protein kinase/tetratricopeptide (TPR) repeat protein
MTVFNRIGPFEIEHEIGRGGMAVVFLARDTRTGAHLALKLVREGAGSEDQQILEAEQRGALLQKQFSAVSSRVPQVHEYGSDGGYFYVAMEYLEGENLSDAIARGPMSAEQALRIASELCRFVEDAHNFEPEGGERPLRSLLHGDLKPRNIRLTPTGHVKVLDFGIAKALSLSRKVTRNDFGSVAYLSPERLESGDVDQYADLWAIGVMLYELLTGEQAFRAPDTRRLEKLIVSRALPPLLTTLEPLALRAVIGKLLAASPADRYASALAIRQDIERLTSGASPLAEQEGWPRPVDEPGTQRTNRDAIDPEATRRTTKAAIPPIPTAATVPPPIPAIPPIPDAAGAVRPAAAPVTTAPAAAAAGATAVAVKPPAKTRRFLKIAVMVFATILFMRELGISSSAARIAGTAPTTELDEIGTLWNEYDSLARRSVLGFGTDDLASALTTQTEALADRVFANYRAPQPTVREAQWRQVRTALARALPTRPRSERLRAMVRYSDGHLHRINGEARKARRLLPEAQREFADAVAAFREAAELRPDWPDPYLGLARTFIYGLDDVDRGADAFQRAERAGYTPGNREAAQLGDGYRSRADSLARSARDVAGLAQERDYLTRAAEQYRQALEHYTKATDFAGVPKNIALAQRSLNSVERRLTALSFSPFESQDEQQPWR